jgi:hypothetical protein
MATALATRGSGVALGSDQVGTIAVGVIVAIIVVGFILALVMNKVVGKVILAVVVVGLSVLVWTQRTSLEDRAHKCDTDVSFFGFHVNLSSAAQQRCAKLNQ